MIISVENRHRNVFQCSFYSQKDADYKLRKLSTLLLFEVIGLTLCSLIIFRKRRRSCRWP